jgi:hypothetical protein
LNCVEPCHRRAASATRCATALPKKNANRAIAARVAEFLDQKKTEYFAKQ